MVSYCQIKIQKTKSSRSEALEVLLRYKPDPHDSAGRPADDEVEAVSDDG